MMSGSTDELNARLDELADRNERLSEALGWFLTDDRFHVAVGGNPIAVEEMLERARAALQEAGRE